MEHIKTNKKLIIKIVLSLAVLGILIEVNIFSTSNMDSTTQKVGYIYNNDKLITPVSDKTQQTTIQKEISGTTENSITYKEADSLLNYDINSNPLDYVQKNSEELVSGYILTIDDEKYYIKDKAEVDYIKNKIYSSIISDSAVLEKYKETGKIENYVVNGMNLTDIKIENTINVTAEKVPKSKIISDEKELLNIILHSNETTTTYTVQANETFEDVLNNTGMSKAQFLLNNTQYKGYPLLQEGDKINTTKINTKLKVATYFENTQEEDIDFRTIYKKTKKLNKGTKKTTQTGEKGRENVTYRTKIVNGNVQYKEDIKHEILKQAQNKIIEEGTKTTSYSGYTEEDTEIAATAGTAAYIWPMDSHTISCGYGCYSGHEGIDITGPYGGTVYAATGGQVIYSQYSPYGGGYECRVYRDGVITMYAHMKQMPSVSVGQQISQGQVIGYMGATGNVTGPHLHFEMRLGASASPFSGYSVNPLPYLP